MEKYMKKMIVLAVAAILATSSVWAASTSSYEEMKQIKKAQREAKAAQKASGTKPETKWSKFWKNEGERSGLGQSTSGAGTFIHSLNPAPFFKSQQEAYNARKASNGGK